MMLTEPEARCHYVQELRVGIRVDMPVSFLIEVLEEVLGINEVPIHTQRDSEWSIDVKWLGF